MTDVASAPPGARATALPASAWAAGWAFLALQLVTLARHGVTHAAAPWPIVSLALSGFVVGWFAAGVLRARPLRTAFVWLLLIVMTVLEVVGVAVDPTDLGGWVEMVFSVAPVALLARFCRSSFFTDQRVLGVRSCDVRPAIGGVVALAVIAGALGGITAASSGDHTQIRVGL